MRLTLLLSGARFEVLALDLSDLRTATDCPALDFLAELRTSEPKVERSLIAVINMHAQHGPLLNERKSRALRDGIFEFKAVSGARLLWFYASGRRTILSHGFKKGADANREIDRAIRLRRAWEETQHGS
ncbi:MAG: type II toxin-antitoxin system RelE/ParE family toxin [Dehalococcoidia bacterium]